MTDLTPEQIKLKDVTHDMIKGCGGLEAAASLCRVGKSVLAEYASEDHPDRFVPIDVVADLEPKAKNRPGWPHVTRRLCEVMGGVFVPLPRAGTLPADVHAALAVSLKEHSDGASTIVAGFADGKFDRGELEHAIKEVTEGIEAAVRLKAVLERMLEDVR
ncbi:hypothetical protein [Sphingomonas colocasiae]|uniref:XRE family transcriptional regulator n=1 Tax=Sphingomonas colocasiae TaxID=1848973 RepID=A0ABS7PXJ7_9SPHN|nr:hypothetical protein [Sphingomonas colocasiae]MBY8826092.1 hypothetical protein [Sphingomonas colocasiae]